MDWITSLQNTVTGAVATVSSDLVTGAKSLASEGTKFLTREALTNISQWWYDPFEGQPVLEFLSLLQQLIETSEWTFAEADGVEFFEFAHKVTPNYPIYFIEPVSSGVFSLSYCEPFFADLSSEVVLQVYLILNDPQAFTALKKIYPQLGTTPPFIVILTSKKLYNIPTSISRLTFIHQIRKQWNAPFEQFELFSELMVETSQTSTQKTQNVEALLACQSTFLTLLPTLAQVEQKVGITIYVAKWILALLEYRLTMVGSPEEQKLDDSLTILLETITDSFRGAIDMPQLLRTIESRVIQKERGTSLNELRWSRCIAETMPFGAPLLN